MFHCIIKSCLYVIQREGALCPHPLALWVGFLKLIQIMMGEEGITIRNCIISRAAALDADQVALTITGLIEPITAITGKTFRIF